MSLIAQATSLNFQATYTLILEQCSESLSTLNKVTSVRTVLPARTCVISEAWENVFEYK